MRKQKLLILDDFFPNLLTGFRVAEYNALMEASPHVEVRSIHPEFELHHARYAARYPQYAHRVRRYEERELATCALAYVNFLNNAIEFYLAMHRMGVPFVVTLYPGGGLGLGDEESDTKLRLVLSHPCLEATIVTTPIARDYVNAMVHRLGLPNKPVATIPGVVIHPLYFDKLSARAPSLDGPLDVCFVAEKYIPLGRGKGYPEFIEAAHRLHESPERDQFRFHVVGSFDRDDIDVTRLGASIQFYGRLETSRLGEFFEQMDLMVSPNRPGFAQKGVFDGCPTACAVEASLCGVTLMITDPLGQNPGYVDGESFWLIPGDEANPPSARWIAESIRRIARPEARSRLHQMGQAGRAVSRRLYDPQYQIGERIRVLRPIFEDIAGAWDRLPAERA